MGLPTLHMTRGALSARLKAASLYVLHRAHVMMIWGKKYTEHMSAL